jgi:hypothetical protein
MKTTEAKVEMKLRAAEAIKAVLSEVSTFKLKEIRCTSASGQSETGFLVCVDVLGHSHTLACEVMANVNARNLRAALKELHECAAHVSRDATPVLIAPHLSPQAQAMCRKYSAAYLDLEGNARLTLGEIFIVKRMFAHSAPNQATLRSTPTIGPHEVPKIPPASLPGSPHHGRNSANLAAARA